ncbi:SUKH-4 family immunity protein [Streptomyces sp. MCA2]|uniref:SUKH-4 family immunity protein n=1 Tax=Streptomyces sp. MCA2 TaxID=2944805 RepID=UPI002021F91E|nr:SUKH-4 family immunity protein [Streptomyces sp. MCA2]MCL7496856.1 SUKH-4 family immunity protein [Streptomyces sp. MCA2]
MSSPSTSYEDIRADDAVERILQWWRDDHREPVTELVGPPESGRTQVLRRVHDSLPAGIWVDATGLTAEEVLQRVLSAAGVESPPHWRAGWRGELGKAGLGDRPVFLANAHRAGRTRRSAQPDRVVRTLALDLAVTAGTKVVVEADPPAEERWLLNLLALRLVSDGPPEHRPVPRELQALALAELPRTPVAVWRELADALGAPFPDAASPLEFARQYPELLTVDGDAEGSHGGGNDGEGSHGESSDGEWVSFQDEYLARRIRRGLGPEQFHRAGDRLTDWLPGHSAGPVAEYAAHALPLHAVQAGRFDEMQHNGELVAHLDQVALLDAACCHAPRSLGRNTPAGDAAGLWLSGVDSLPQGTWAAWLHLMSTVRGDTEFAAGIERSGVSLPWKVRWANWRPPGGWDLSYLRPGPLLTLFDATAGVPAAGRRIVAGQGAWDRRVRIWDAQTGEQLGGPWSDGVPQPGQAEPLWPRDHDPQITQPWVQLTNYGVAPDLLTETLRLDGLVVVGGLGGLFAVEPASPDRFDGLGDLHGEPFLAEFGRVDGGTDWDAPDRAVLEELFGPGTVRRLAAEDLPAGLADEEARALLTGTGLPAFRGAEMRLTALDEEPLAELSADDVWEFTEEEDVPESAGQGAYYRLGIWGGEPLVLDGEGGGVYVVPGEDGHGYEQPLVAGSLPAFVAMLQGYLVGRCLLPMASSLAERKRIRDLIELDLAAVDEEGAESAAWTDVLYDDAG